MKSIASSRFATVYASVPLLVIAVLPARCGRSSPNPPAPATGHRPRAAALPRSTPSPSARILGSIEERRARVRPRGAIHRGDSGAAVVACRPDRRSGRRGRDLSLRHEDLREGSAREALLFDDVQLQVLFQLGEWAAARADSN